MKQLKRVKYWMAGLALLGIVSCGKDYYRYEKYIENGPIVYPGRPDTLVALAGKERILLKWKVPSDLNVTGYKLFWNFGIDSLAVSGRKEGSSDSITVELNDMPQGSYSFTVYAYDKEGHRSVGTLAMGNVYGSTFASTLFNRPYNALVRDTAGLTLTVAWVGLDAKSIGTEWNYTDMNGAAATLFSPLDDSTFIDAIDVTQPISYRSLFLPEKRAIDTFYTEFKSL